jgi:hypothetical protein
MHPIALLAGLFAVLPGPSAPQTTPGAKQEGLEPLVALPDDFVRTARVPGGGRHPKVANSAVANSAVANGAATLAVLAFQGDDEAGELVLACSQDEGASFGAPARLAPGAVRSWDGMHSGALDIGPSGRVHVAWISGSDPGVLCYAEASAEGVPEATVELGSPDGLCGTTAVAVDSAGSVHLFYVAAMSPAEEAPGKSPAQPGFRIWMRRSSDGAPFEAAVPVDPLEDDVSSESAIAANVDAATGTLYVLYRNAARAKPTGDVLTRDVRLLFSEDAGRSFQSTRVENWRQQRDPRTVARLVQEPGTTLALWNSRGTILWTPIRRHVKKAQLPTEVKVDGGVVRTHPAGASGGDEVLIAWLERPRGKPEEPSRVVYRVWQRDLRIPIGDGVIGTSDGASAPAVLARKAGGFTILY